MKADDPDLVAIWLTGYDFPFHNEWYAQGWIDGHNVTHGNTHEVEVQIRVQSISNMFDRYDFESGFAGALSYLGRRFRG